MGSDLELIGKTLREAMAITGLKQDQIFVIDEPPGIARCVFGKTSEGHQLRLYFRRDALPINFQMNWTVADCEGLEVTGVARYVSGRWVVCGQTMLIQPIDEHIKPS